MSDLEIIKNYILNSIEIQQQEEDRFHNLIKTSNNKNQLRDKINFCIASKVIYRDILIFIKDLENKERK